MLPAFMVRVITDIFFHGRKYTKSCKTFFDHVYSATVLFEMHDIPLVLVFLKNELYLILYGTFKSATCKVGGRCEFFQKSAFSRDRFGGTFLY